MRPEHPFAQEQHPADGQEQGQQEPGADREPAERGGAADLALDLVGLGLREVDVGAGEAEQGVLGRRRAGRGDRRGGAVAAGRAEGVARRRAARGRIRADRVPAVVLRRDGQASGGRPHDTSATLHDRPSWAPRRRSAMTVRYARAVDASPLPTRRILAAELLAVGTELTVGETTDTNSGELARSLVAHGVTRRPHDLAARRRSPSSWTRCARPSRARTSS